MGQEHCSPDPRDTEESAHHALVPKKSTALHLRGKNGSESKNKGVKKATSFVQGNNQILRRTNKGPVQTSLPQVSEHAQAARLMHYHTTYVLPLEKPDPFRFLLRGHLPIANTVAKCCTLQCTPVR